MRPRFFIKPHDLKPGWPGLALAGVLALILMVLFATTGIRIQRTRELMASQLTGEARQVIRSLEGAARASARHGLWQTLMLQGLVEEMGQNPQVLAIKVLDARGQVLAGGRKRLDGERPNRQNAIDQVPPDLMEMASQGVPFNRFLRHALLVGSPFMPVPRMEDGQLPPWMDDPPDPDKRGGQGMGMMMRSGREALRRFAEQINGAYVLVWLSTEQFDAARNHEIRQSLLLAGLIFLAAGLAASLMIGLARRRSRELESLRKEVSENQHLAAVGRLAGHVAHEVRNPLSALRGLVQLLAKKQPEGSKEAQYAQVAVSEVDRLERVVSGLLEYTRPRPARPLELDLCETVASVLTLMGDDPRAEGVEIVSHCGPDLPKVAADPDQLRQMIINLVVNALEALNGRGRLELDARVQGKQFKLTIGDNGPGLDPKQLEEIFDPFFSTKDRGTGLGLALARRMARAVDGDLVAANHPQGGAVFTLSLPLAPKEAKA